MADVPPVKAGGADDAIAKMEATFNMAIEKSAKITEISTAKKRNSTPPNSVRRTDSPNGRRRRCPFTSGPQLS